MKTLEFLEVAKDSSRGNKKTPQSDYLDAGDIPIVDQGAEFIAGYTNNPEAICSVSPPVVIFGDHSRAVKFVDFQFGMGADGTKVITAKEGVDTKYLYHAMRYLDIPSAGYSRHYKFLKEAVISIPDGENSLEEQKRIAAILDDVDESIRLRKESIKALDDLIQSTFISMFGDPVTNPMEWDVEKLENVANFHAGSSLPETESYNAQEGGYLVVKVSDMNTAENLNKIVKAKLWTQESGRGITAPSGAVLIPKRGGAIGTNKKRLLTRSVVLDPNLMAISPKPLLDKLYLLEWFRGFDLLTITSGSSVPQLNKRDLAPLKISIPPLSKQQEFATTVESIEEQKSLYQGQLTELENYFSCLQQKAFKGEL